MSTLSMQLSRHVRRWFLLLAPLAVAGCGGGGGGGGGAAPGGAGAPLAESSGASLVITSANQKAVAADALDSATDLSLAALGSMLAESGAQLTSTTAAAAPANLVALALRLAGMVPAGPMVAGVAVQRPISCASGTGSVSGNVAVGGRLTAGDAMTFTTNNCQTTVNGVAGTMSGSISVTVRSGSFDANNVVYPIHLVLAIQANNMTIALPEGSSTMNGDQQVDVTNTSASAATEVLSGSTMTVSITVRGATHVSTLKDYVQNIAANGTTATETMTATIETDNPSLGNVSYRLGTPTPLAFASGAITSGSMLVTGRGSALLVVAVGKDTLNLQLDENGDGTYESTTPTTSSELLDILNQLGTVR